MNGSYDVIILGGGLSGLTLALQLKLTKPDISLLVLEKRLDDAAVATHKVGESTVELGSYYLREVLQLKEYLTNHQLPKFGFRFFFSPQHRNNIVRRVEMGSKIAHPIPTHQIDRGILENDLVQICAMRGIEIIQGASVQDVHLSADGHETTVTIGENTTSYTSKWVIDATGRRSFLKRKLGLEKPSDHDINSAWFRLGCEIDPDHWSDDEAWRNYLAPGRRRLATNHLMGTGYWVWLIPLVSGATSIGIVADPRYHPFEKFHTFEKAMQWFSDHEPQAAAVFEQHRDKVLDFKVMKHFAHDVKQFYSTDRWAVTGEAGAFLDPFYSPGTDFISLSNSWITSLVKHDLEGEDIALRTLIYEHTHRELYNGWVSLYRNMYGTFGHTQVMVMKVVWDWGTYWGIPTVIFKNGGYTDVNFLKKYASNSHGIGRRFALLNEKMQELFRVWSQYENETYEDVRINVFDLECLLRFHRALSAENPPEDLIGQVSENLTVLEHMAAEMFRLAFEYMYDTSLDIKIDPYAVSATDSLETLIEKSTSETAFRVSDEMQSDLAKVWISTVHPSVATYV
ncbi:MAG: tryptophan 7-halogenase [Saprospiraceae bacterium]|nr:tryptophan 7-halogenase [Saprospiraceae bacterium]